jgi:hypothetical protein
VDLSQRFNVHIERITPGELFQHLDNEPRNPKQNRFGQTIDAESGNIRF